MDKKITIAIDGFSGCGKSTLAKDLARRLEYTYIDSGAMYRAVTYYVLQKGIDVKDHRQVERALREINLKFAAKVSEGIFLNDQLLIGEIRSSKVNAHVSTVAAIESVRTHLVAQQRQIAQSEGVIMDGRDIGTVVFPKAELKLFITATLEERVRRRVKENMSKSIPVSTLEIRKNLQHRDHIDTTREISPLKQASDAVLIDNTNLTRIEQLEMVSALVDCRKERKIEED